MKQKKTMRLLALGTLCCSTLISGCSNILKPDQQVEDGIRANAIKKVYQTRDLGLQARIENAWNEYRIGKQLRPSSLRNAGETGKYDLIGCSYDLESGIIGDLENVKAPVIDLVKRAEIKELANTLSIIPLRESDIRISVQYNDEKREEYIRQSVDGLFDVSVNLGPKIFGIHANYNNYFCNIFSKKSINESNLATGRMDVIMREEKVFLNTSSSVCRRIATSCVNPAFTEALYSEDIKGLFKTYGPYVVSGYYTGGRVIASYLGEHKSSMEKDSVYKQMKHHIEGGFSLTKDNGSVSFTQTKEYVSTNMSYKDRVRVYCLIQAKGGSTAFQITTPPKMMTEKGFGLNLTDWYKSLSDTKNCYPMDIIQNGLLGLENYVIETNFSRRIKDSAAGYLKDNKLDMPVVEIGRVYVISQKGKKLYEVAPILHTRHGDRIVFWNINYRKIPYDELAQNENNETFELKAGQQATRMGGVFNGIEIYSNDGLKLNPVSRKQVVITTTTSLDPAMFKKWINPTTGVVYLYNKKERFAFSFPEYMEDLITDTYTMSDWAMSIEEQPISAISLTYYTIIGL